MIVLRSYITFDRECLMESDSIQVQMLHFGSELQIWPEPPPNSRAGDRRQWTANARGKQIIFNDSMLSASYPAVCLSQFSLNS